jgi:Protein of unknown function (DUF4244)
MTVLQSVNASQRIARGRRIGVWLRDDEGAATAEYAVATMAAVGFAGLLVVILRGDEVRAVLTDLIRAALSTNL